MTETGKAKVIDKIRKLLALGQSPNENEASNAMAKAMALAMEYELDLSDVEQTKEVNSIGELSLTGVRSGIAHWERNLMNGVCRSLNCKALRSRTTNMRGTARQEWFCIGGESDSIVVQFLYSYLKEALHTLSDIHMKGLDFYNNNQRKKYRESYMLGATATVLNKVHDKYVQEVPQTEAVTALMVRKDTAVDNYLESIGCKTIKRRQHNVEARAYMSGKVEGASIGVNQAMKQGKAPQRNLQLN